MIVADLVLWAAFQDVLSDALDNNWCWADLVREMEKIKSIYRVAAEEAKRLLNFTGDGEPIKPEIVAVIGIQTYKDFLRDDVEPVYRDYDGGMDTDVYIYKRIRQKFKR